MKLKFLALVLLIPACLFAEYSGKEPAAIAEVFAKALNNLSKVENYKADFSVKIKSMKGDVEQNGTFVHQLPYSFRADTQTVAMGGMMNVNELTVCNGKVGWELMIAPNGKVVSASRWGKVSMAEMYYAFFNKAQYPKVASDYSNTYFFIKHDNLFDKVKKSGSDTILSGKMRAGSQRYAEIRRMAASMGAAGLSNYLPNKVEVRINKYGMPIGITQFNLLGQKIIDSQLKNVKVNTKIKASTFDYKAPANVDVLDIDSALTKVPIHVPHKFLNKKAGKIDVNYMSGKVADVKIGKKPLVVTFFATRSKNSCSFMPILDKIYSKYSKRGVKFVAITDAEDLKPLKKYRTTSKITMPLYVDHSGKTIARYSIKVVPKTFIINDKGIVIDVIEGNPEGLKAELEKSIQKII